MAVVLDGVIGIQRDRECGVTNIEWFMYGLPDTTSAPEDVTFLHQSFGADSPQSLTFTLESEEYVVYLDWQNADDRVSAMELKQFITEYGYIVLSGLSGASATSGVVEKKEWLVPVAYFENYESMIDSLPSTA